MQKTKTWLDVIATWVTILGAFAGGIFAVVQYLEKAQSERVKAALEYVQLFDKEPWRAAQSRLSDFWNSRVDEVFKKARAGEKELYVFLDTAFRENRLESDTSTLLSFYENIRTCTCARICDAVVVRQFFGKGAFDLHGLAYPYISEQRRRLYDNSIGVGLELLAKNYQSDSTFDDIYCLGRQTPHSDAQNVRQ